MSKPKTMTVGELRSMIAGVSPATPVVIGAFGQETAHVVEGVVVVHALPSCVYIEAGTAVINREE